MVAAEVEVAGLDMDGAWRKETGRAALRAGPETPWTEGGYARWHARRHITAATEAERSNRSGNAIRLGGTNIRRHSRQ
jgi:hypothetical protein